MTSGIEEADDRAAHDGRPQPHSQAFRNPLSPAEKAEMHAFGKAAALLSILKSRARRVLGGTLDTRGTP
jgi:hypothetical protein